MTIENDYLIKFGGSLGLVFCKNKKIKIDKNLIHFCI
jgi:hypothetical protein